MTARHERRHRRSRQPNPPGRPLQEALAAAPPGQARRSPWSAMSASCSATRRTPTRSITSRWSPAGGPVRRGHQADPARARGRPAAGAAAQSARPGLSAARPATTRRSQSFDRAIALEPDFADAHGNRANVLADMGRAEEALDGFDRALALRPDNAEDLLQPRRRAGRSRPARRGAASYDAPSR